MIPASSSNGSSQLDDQNISVNIEKQAPELSEFCDRQDKEVGDVLLDHEPVKLTMADKIVRAKEKDIDLKKSLLERLGATCDGSERQMRCIRYTPIALFEKAIDRQDRMRGLGCKYKDVFDIFSFQTFNELAYEKAIKAKGRLSKYDISLDRMWRVNDCRYIDEQTEEKICMLGDHFPHIPLRKISFCDMSQHSLESWRRGIDMLDKFAHVAGIENAVGKKDLMSCMYADISDVFAFMNQAPSISAKGVRLQYISVDEIRGLSQIKVATWELFDHYKTWYHMVSGPGDFTKICSFLFFLQQGGKDFLDTDPDPTHAISIMVTFFHITTDMHLRPVVQVGDTTASLLGRYASLYKDAYGEEVKQSTQPQVVQDRVKKLFRFGEEYEEDFYFNQSIGNCYAASTLLGLHHSPHFQEAMVESIDYVVGSGKADGYWTVRLPGGKQGTQEQVSRRDLDTQQGFAGTLQEYYESLSEKEWHEFLNKMMLSDREQEYGDSLRKRSIQSVKREHITVDVRHLERYKIAFEEGTGDLYESMVRYFQHKQLLAAIDAPLGYKILEAAIHKRQKGRGQVDRKKERGGGSPLSVLETVLPYQDWYWESIDFSTGGMYEKFFYQEYIRGIVGLVSSGDAVVIPHVLGYEDDDDIDTVTSSYFYYKGKRMAYQHGYTVVGFDEETGIIDIANPWNVHNEHYSLQVTTEEFIQLFDGLTVALKKKTEDMFSSDF